MSFKHRAVLSHCSCSLHAECGLRTVLWWHKAIRGRKLGRQDQEAVKSTTSCPAPLVTFISTSIPPLGRCGWTRGRGQRHRHG
ncbi:hypothetical protein DL98DRAFT_18389 [Cadophora sp. DSE1049]|nr:hypothetical protein DL98DRAFT_18389 [Cadophora sp. DSE1049]